MNEPQSLNHHVTINETNGVQRLILALFVNLVLTVVQVIGGIISGSIALVADALHNFSDAVALLIALIARKWAEKPADENRTFGYKRAELIGAMINLTTLILIGVYLLFEAIMRVFEPEPITGWIVVIIACVALVVDVITAVLTYSVAFIIAGTLIIFYEWYIVDTICTFLIAGYVLFHGYIEIKSVIRILMQSVPADIDINEVIKKIEEIENIMEVHHLHVWELNEHDRSLEAHVVITESGYQDAEIIKGQIKDVLNRSFHISHSTIEFEYENQSENNNCCDKSIITPH